MLIVTGSSLRRNTTWNCVEYLWMDLWWLAQCTLRVLRALLAGGVRVQLDKMACCCQRSVFL